MKGGRASVIQRLRVQLALDRRCVIDDAQPRPAGEQAKVPRFLRRGRAMNEVGRVAFDDAVRVAHPELMLIDQQTIARRFAFEERDGSFDSPGATDERSGQERDDAEMGDEERDVMFLPGPAGEGRDNEVRREKEKPDVEPGGAVDIGAGHFRIEGRFVERARDGADDEDREQNDRQLEGSEKAEDRVALPAWAGSGGRCGHCGERAFSARSSTRSTREFASFSYSCSCS